MEPTERTDPQYISPRTKSVISVNGQLYCERGVSLIEAEYGYVPPLKVQAPLTVDVEHHGCPLPQRDGRVGGHAGEVASRVGVHRRDGQVAAGGHPLPVGQHFLCGDKCRRNNMKTLQRKGKKGCKWAWYEVRLCTWAVDVSYL